MERWKFAIYHLFQRCTTKLSSVSLQYKNSVGKHQNCFFAIWIFYIRTNLPQSVAINFFWKRKDFCFFKSFRTKLSGNYIIVYFSLESMRANLHINIHILTFQKKLVSIHSTNLFEYKTELGRQKHWNNIWCILI